ncbi:MAG: alpha-D-ribose 1-methylphosphonate 5-triphosphate diphosphatase [Pseudomonadota bacterium]
MTAPLPYLRLIDGMVLRHTGMEVCDVVVENNKLRIDADAPRGDAVSLSGYYLLPGIIDLHGDAFEHHIAPRPSAPLPLGMGLAATDREAASCGVTTAWMAQSWSWEGGRRGPDFAQEFLAAHQALKPQLATDLRVQIRCETYTMDREAQLIAAVRRYGVDYVIFNNHLDEAIELARDDPGKVADWAARAGRTPQAHMALVEETLQRSREVPRYLCNLATAFDNLGVKYGSHDDADAHSRERFAMIGAKVCEFPMAVTAAAVARAWGDPVLMGAPNVVRGGSQAGKVSAMALIRDGLCTALVSDYHYPSLAQAVFRIFDEGVLPLERAWALIASHPARIMGLADRGEIEDGMRADLTIVNKTTRQIEGTIAAGRWSYLAAGLAHRLSLSADRGRIAAE